MGLDQYVYQTKIKNLNKKEKIKNTAIWESYEDFIKDFDEDYSEFWYWRKHPNLHGWFEQIFLSYSNSDVFNSGNYVQITLGILDELEIDVKEKTLPYTEGFFFGEDENSDEEMNNDLKFIQKAREYLLEDKNNVLVYTSWW